LWELVFQPLGRDLTEIDIVELGPPKVSNVTTRSNGFSDIFHTSVGKVRTDQTATLVTVVKDVSIDTIGTTATMLRTVTFVIIATPLRIVTTVIIGLLDTIQLIDTVVNTLLIGKISPAVTINMIG
jgi:hypothetical protein